MDRLYKEPIPQFTDTFIRMYPELRENDSGLCSKTVTFVVTQQCQLRCSYCYQHGKNAVNVMSKEVAKKKL